jgi:hypothetical protein
MRKIIIAAAMLLTPALASAQLGAGMGTEAYAHGHSPEGDVVSHAAGTPMHKSHVEHYAAQQLATAKTDVTSRQETQSPH